MAGSEVYNAATFVVLGGTGTRVYQSVQHAITGRTTKGTAIHAATLQAVISATTGVRVSQVAAAAVVVPPVVPPPVPADTYFYGGPEADETHVIPANVTEIEFRLWGASGGAGQGFSPAGTLTTAGGSYVEGKHPVVPGDVLTIRTGRAGRGANAVLGVVGAGGWPDGQDGIYDRDHDAYGGGAGGSTSLLLNGVEIARAGGSPGTAGFPAGGSSVGSGSTYLASTVVDGYTEEPTSEVAAGAIKAINPDDRVGWGVLNADPDSAVSLDGRDGAAWLRYYE